MFYTVLDLAQSGEVTRMKIRVSIRKTTGSLGVVQKNNWGVHWGTRIRAGGI